MTAAVSRMLDEARRGLEPLYGPRLKRLVLYGSQARGEAGLGSDVDLLVVLDGTVRPAEEVARTGQLAAEISLRHNAVLSLAFVSSRRFGTEHSPLLMNVRRDGVAL